MEPKKHKRKIRYTVMVISDSAEGGIRQYFLEQGITTAVAVLLVCMLLAGSGYCIYSAARQEKAEAANQTLHQTVEALTQEKEDLLVRNDELSKNVTLLSDTINQKVQKEEEDAEKFIPTGFPLAGAATIQESSELIAEADAENPAEEAMAEVAEENPAEEAMAEVVEENPAEEVMAEVDEQAEAMSEEEEHPIVVFLASAGTSVIATGSGVVEAIEEDAAYGGRILVNHGNGYVTIYRCVSPAKVKVGDEITKGTMLIEMTTEAEELGYQIMKDEAYIDPLELMEIYG